MLSGKRFFSIIVFLILIYSSYAQSYEPFNGKGIQFIEGLSWNQILVKAKTEGKFIFLDCYTTWCVPCKIMEKNVYSNKEVGAIYNDKFISVKAQMDTSVSDNELVKSFYSDADNLKKKYKIDAYPTIIYFTPDGEMLNRIQGAMDVGEFIRVSNDVLNPEKNYYNLISRYEKGDLSLEILRILSKTSMLLGDTLKAKVIAASFVNRVQLNDLNTRESIQFLSDNTQKTTDKGFQIFFKYSKEINEVMKEQDYAQGIIQQIIARQIVFPVLNALPTNEKPDWNKLFSSVKNKYGIYYAERVILNAKYIWAKGKKDYSNYTKFLIQYVNKFRNPNISIFTHDGSIEDLRLNNYAWDIFKYSNEKEELIEALDWSAKAIRMNPIANWMDTYANLLYKLGYTKLAIDWQEAAAKLDPDDKDIETALQKMKKGEPTWTILK